MLDFNFDDSTTFAVVTVPNMVAAITPLQKLNDKEDLCQNKKLPVMERKNGIWYAAPGGQGWSKATSRKASIVETDAPPPGGGTIKPSSGRVIRIINNMDHTIQCRVLLNLRTSQPFEEVVEDLGQVLKMNGAKRMYTVSGQEVRSFSQLRNEFADVDTFYLGAGSVGGRPRRRRRGDAGRDAVASEEGEIARAPDRHRRGPEQAAEGPEQEQAEGAVCAGERDHQDER
ncbi:hypothetical protein NQ318_017995 [Aromia moschata]|uniref:Doublecortin domain-containing protein n=1 Tax=Aromia moschata TaxID=1265417 RepID=A0AAV8Y941_9CUCU|nr:hypothetical protein NQ318_017995 [Aromia moschata]